MFEFRGIGRCHVAAKTTVPEVVTLQKWTDTFYRIDTRILIVVDFMVLKI
jgi:hypothetical protein